jgi:hypothetical protein
MTFKVDFVAVGRPYVHFPAIALLPVLLRKTILVAILTANFDGDVGYEFFECEHRAISW